MMTTENLKDHADTPSNTNRWVNYSYLTRLPTIEIEGLAGYVLPHAGTKHSGELMSNILRFQNPAWTSSKVDPLNVRIIYSRSISSEDPLNCNETSTQGIIHEFCVPKQSLVYLLPNFNINVNTSFSDPDILVLSADFSHYEPFQIALKKESKAATAILFDKYDHPVMDVVDTKEVFKEAYNKWISKKNKEYVWNWVGRSRSKGTHAVGYLGFLLLPRTPPKSVHGFFITAYDSNFNHLECLGKFYDSKPVSSRPGTSVQDDVAELKTKVQLLAPKSRLHPDLKGSVASYMSCTYLTREPRHTVFIPGFHGIRTEAFYLSNVILEHYHASGTKILPTDTEYIRGLPSDFDLHEVSENLALKAHSTNSSTQPIYYSERTIPI